MRRTQAVATRWPSRSCAVFAAVTMFAMYPAAAEIAEGTPFGRAPLCEASAALIVDCPGSSGSCLLVGDNEEEASLSWFRLDGSPLEKTRQQQGKFKGGKIGDIEALAAAGGGRIAVFGSHSRSTTCSEAKKRWRFGVIDGVKDKGLELALTESKEFNVRTLFGRNLPKGSLIEAASLAIKTAEDKAKKAENDAEQCNQAPGYNAEGAVNVSEGKDPNIWIGLRAPLLTKHPQEEGRSDLAMLLHLKDLQHYTFDGVAVLDLGGRGIRELAYTDDGVVWVIAGPPHDLGKTESKKPWQDKKAPFRLMRFQAAELKTKKIIVPEQLQDLPPSAEGLAVYGETIFVLRDGDKPGKGKDQCGDHARYLTVPRPPAISR